MLVPNPPNVRTLQQISPSIYEALLRCKARGAWSAFGDGNSLPQHPKALLGTCFHSVVEEAHKGRLTGLDEQRILATARDLFDARAGSLYERAHPLLRIKFNSPERLPYYNLYRERACLEASSIAQRVDEARSLNSEITRSPRFYAEKRLVSSDGLLVGRPDLIEADAGEIVDYKIGETWDESSDAISEPEGRQLRLYVHLALDNGIGASRVVIARANGSRPSIDVSKDDADIEGRKARELLSEFNMNVGAEFQDLAEPSVENCTFCPCIPLCERFWMSASPGWAERCGIHFEGRVRSVEESTVQGIRLMTLGVEVQRGTLVAGQAFLEQVPEMWITADGAPVPREGEVLRVVNGRVAGDTSPRVIRADRTSTSVWTIGSPS